jgi:cytochrome c553
VQSPGGLEEKGESRKMRITRQHIKRILAAGAMVCIAVLVSSGSRVSATGAGTATDPAATYKAKCASCHGVDGSGNTAAGKAMKVRDLRSADVQKQSDAQLYAAIANGKEKMPKYEKSLGADTCKALVAHIRTLAGK